jgi:hypothetical protein
MKTALRLTVMLLLLAVSNLSAATLYVSLGGTNPTPPYTNWATAATNIQQAVGAAAAGDEVVVTNGVYAGGVAVTNPLTLRSVNGPQFTVINGGGTTRCASLTDGASLSGFTLTGGSAYEGGGVWCPSTNGFVVVTNCTLTGNSAGLGGGAASVQFQYALCLYNCTLTGNSAWAGSGTGNQWGGGGAYFCKLYNCTLTGNSANAYGGGADWCWLYGCTLSRNSASWGGGVDSSSLYNCTLTGNVASGGAGGASWSTLFNCTLTGNSASQYSGGAAACSLYNCIVYFNTATNYYNSDLTYCCTTPAPGGVGNITNAPLFVDYANGNLRLQSNSPCINAGNNAYVTTATDLDGRPRIVGGTVDMGAYEFQPGVSGAFIGWLQQYGLPTDGSADFIDSDHDGMNNWQEWVCSTCPTNAQSVLRLVSATPAGTNITVTWQSVAGVTYFLERSTNLNTSFTHSASFIMGQAGTTSYADTNAAGAGPLFYRVGVLPSGAN